MQCMRAGTAAGTCVVAPSAGKAQSSRRGTGASNTHKHDDDSSREEYIPLYFLIFPPTAARLQRTGHYCQFAGCARDDLCPPACVLSRLLTEMSNVFTWQQSHRHVQKQRAAVTGGALQTSISRGQAHPATSRRSAGRGPSGRSNAIFCLIFTCCSVASARMGAAWRGRQRRQVQAGTLGGAPGQAAQKVVKDFLDAADGITRNTLNRTVLDSGLRRDRLPVSLRFPVSQQRRKGRHTEYQNSVQGPSM